MAITKCLFEAPFFQSLSPSFPNARRDSYEISAKHSGQNRMALYGIYYYEGAYMFTRVICFGTALLVGSTILFSGAGAEPRRHDPNPVNGHKLALFDMLCVPCRRARSEGSSSSSTACHLLSIICRERRHQLRPDNEFILKTHQDVAHPKEMPNPMLLEQEASDIAAYIIVYEANHEQPPGLAFAKRNWFYTAADLRKLATSVAVDTAIPI